MSKRSLKKICLENRFATTNVIKSQLQDINVNASERTVRRKLKDLNFKTCRPTRKSKSTPATKSKHLNWAKHWRDKDVYFWRSVFRKIRDRTQQQKLKRQEQLSIEKLRLEIELSRNANQSATQNNGQTSRVRSLDEIVKMVRLLTVKVPNKSDGRDYFFSSLEKAFASEMVSDELKPKVLLCMLGDKVSNLLVNLGEVELKDYESLKQVVLKEYEPSPKICLENFRKAKRNSDETFSQFASRLTSMWLYYCKLREANDFESVNQLIVADKMFEMLDSETATHIGVRQGEGWYKPRDLGKQCDIFYASKGKSYDEPERAKWNDSEKRSFNGSWGKQSFGEKKSDNFSSRKNFDKEGTELVDGTVAARVDLLGKVIPRRAIEDKLSKLVKTSISVDGKLVHALVDSGTEITVIKKDLVPGISVEGASTIYLKGIFDPAVKCPLVYVPIGLATGGQVNVVHQQVLCALAEVLVEDVLLPPDVLDMLGGAQSEENSLAQSSQDLRVDSGNVDETEVSLGILPEKAQEHTEDSQRNITSCRNEVGTLGTKDEEVTVEMDKGIMVADSFRSEQECCAQLALVWKHAKEGKGNHYKVDGYLFHRDKILGESIGQLVIPKCRRTEVLRLAHTSVFSSHMGSKKKIERIKYSFFWEGLRADVKKFCESCKECQLTRSIRIKDRSPITPVARSELPFQVVNMDLIGTIDPPNSKGHTYILCLVDQHTRIYLLLKREGFVEKNSAASWVTVLDLWKQYVCRSLTKNYAACFMSFGICMTKKVRFKIEYTSYGCNLTAQVLRMLEQFVVSRIVDIDILMQIWKNRVKQINFVLEWVRQVGSEIITAKGKLEPDERTFEILQKKTQFVRRRDGEKFHSDCVVRTVKHPTKIMIWSVISGKGTGRLDVVKARSIKAFLAEQNIPLLDWPGNSPDMNPIENIWKLMKKEVAKDVITNKTQLLERIIHVCNPPPQMQETVQSCIDSMPRRIEALIAAKGGSTKY
ncbi:retrovirus-related Pol polyprotein from transposon opus [Trichonephila clavipes]|nr:retrovirus-related Pol polyprotein from transposon opus [Trichonephila clavipes]